MTSTIELNGKTYMVRCTPAGPLVRVKTKTGWRSLAGHGRAYRGDEIAQVVAAYREQKAGSRATEA